VENYVEHKDGEDKGGGGYIFDEKFAIRFKLEGIIV
jgi:hypothetical protein